MTVQKRSPESDLPTFDDPADLVNAVISTLQAPDEKTNVAMDFANDRNAATEVQAYAKIAGRDWTYYVRSLAIAIGRNTDAAPVPPPSQSQQVQIDLGPAKVVSRQHATITYNIDLRCWELKVLGRNGARIDSVKMPVGPEHATPLHSGAILDIGGTQMMFILPDTPPSISEKMLSACLSRYEKSPHKMPRVGTHSHASSTASQASQTPSFQAISNFHMFDKGSLSHSHPQVSAVSLQSNLDQDLSKEDSKDIKPPYSYATMITQAILSNPDGVMSLSEIYNWISSHYAYYKYSKTGWQNSIRHNLSLNKAFEKVPRRPNEPGKGMKWQISESYRSDFLKKVQTGTLSKSRRGSSVSRTLQIHLATHQNLPEAKNYPKTHQRNGSMDYPMGNGSDQMSMSNQMQMPNQMSASMSTSMSNSMSTMSNQAPQMANQMPNQKSNTLPYPVQMGNVPYQVPNAYQMPYNGNYQQPQRYNQNQNQTFLPPYNGDKPLELASPLRNPSLDSNTPRSLKPGSGMFSQQPGNGAPGYPGVNLYKTNSGQPMENGMENGAPHSFANTSNLPNTSESMVQNSTAPTTSNTSDLGLGFTSPKKIAPLEAFTPERGSKNLAGKANANQSSPAFWNFVQFSTPNGQTPGRKSSDGSNERGSPTSNRGANGKRSQDLYNDSPFDSRPEDTPGDVKEEK